MISSRTIGQEPAHLRDYLEEWTVLIKPMIIFLIGVKIRSNLLGLCNYPINVEYIYLLLLDWPSILITVLNRIYSFRMGLDFISMHV